MNIFERESQNIFQTYKRFPIVVKNAVGCRIYDTDGNEYLDFLAGIAVNALGHSHPAIIKAVSEQINKYMHISNYFYQEPQIELAEKLKDVTGYDRVFYSNSGTEANEGAIKLARRWGSSRNKFEIIGFSGGFHGRTYGALSLMDKPQYKDKMGPYLANTRVINYNNPDELREFVGDSTCAIILEFVQGEGGLTTVTEEFIDTINELKEKYGFLVIADEIQAGVGRTGKFFAFNHFNINPDIVTVAKGIGGGLPLGAILAKEELANIWDKGMHGTTYGGNAVAVAAGLAVINELQKGVLENVNNVSPYFIEKLTILKNKYPEKILEVRGLGLMLGLLLSFDAGELVKALIKKNVIANAASGKVLRIVPPLIISKSDVDEFIEKLDSVLAQ